MSVIFLTFMSERPIFKVKKIITDLYTILITWLLKPVTFTSFLNESECWSPPGPRPMEPARAMFKFYLCQVVAMLSVPII